MLLLLAPVPESFAGSFNSTALSGALPAEMIEAQIGGHEIIRCKRALRTETVPKCIRRAKKAFA